MIEDRPPTVYDDGLGVDERRLVRRQEHGGPRHLLRPPDPLWRMQLVGAAALRLGSGNVFQYSMAIGVSM